MNVGITGIAYALPAREMPTGELQRQVAEASGLKLPPRLFEQATGVRFQMKIDLPPVGWIRLTA